MSNTKRHVKPVIQALVLMLTILFNPAHVTRASSQGDVLVFLDQSQSMQFHNPGFSIAPWLVGIDKALPEAGDMTLVGFDERVHPPIMISKKDVGSAKQLQDKLKEVKLDGWITNYELPLQYLLNYKGDVAMAVIISDGEPSIWTDRSYYLSRLILNDARYRELNDRYKVMSSQGLSRAERYRQLSGLYLQKSIGLTEEKLAEAKKNLGSPLVFIDVYGKFNYLKQWADLASARFVVAKSPNDVKQKLSEQVLEQKNILESKEKSFAEAGAFENKPLDNKPVENASLENKPLENMPLENKSMENTPMENKPAEDLSKNVVQPQGQTGVTPFVSQSDSVGITLIIGIVVMVLGLLWIARGGVLKQKAARKREVTKKSIEETVEEYRQKKLAEADSEVAGKFTELEKLLREQKLAIERACESLKAEKLAANTREIEAEKVIQAEAMRKDLVMQFKDEEEAYIKEIQQRKKLDLEELTNWKLTETAKQQQELADRLAKTEAESRERIEKWEQDASARVQSLLENQYLELRMTYKNDLRLLAEKRDAAEKRLASINFEIDTQQEILERRRHDIRQEIENYERRMQVDLKNQEALLWQELVVETRKMKEEATARVRKWEKEEKKRFLEIA